MPGVLSKRSRYMPAAAWLSAWWSRVLARISWSKSPPTIGTALIAATGGTRRSRSGAMRPRRAASCSGRSSTEAGKASVRKDQDTQRAGRLDEARGGDRLARRGRVAEAVAADGAWVVLHRFLGELGVLDLDDERRVLVLVLVLLLLQLLCCRCMAVAVAVRVVPLARGDELGQHPGERVD